MTIFTATFNAVAVTAAQDVFQITAPTAARVRIRDVKIAQYTEFADAQAELLSILVIRGNTVTGTVVNAITPTNLEPWSRTVSSGLLVSSNNTTVASGGSPATLIADSFNVAAGWSLRDSVQFSDGFNAAPAEGIWLSAGQILVVRITAPADSITMNGTLVFEEV